jgi:hypothetical protein
MAERDRQLQRDVDVETGVEAGTFDDPSPDEATSGDQRRTRIRKGAGRIISVRGLVMSLFVVTTGVLLADQILPLGGVDSVLGVVAGAFLYGLGSDVRHYVELALAGAIVGGTSALLGNLVLSLVGAGIPMVAFGAGAGALAAVTGHYFGRDLRDGLTRDL